MIKEDYVSYEVAKLLKEKGFNEPCYTCYIDDNEISRCDYLSTNFELIDNAFSAPTLQMAMKWLRNKGIYIQIRRNVNTYLYGAIMLKDGSDTYATIPSELETYEEAIEAALKYALENLI